MTQLRCPKESRWRGESAKFLPLQYCYGYCCLCFFFIFVIIGFELLGLQTCAGACSSGVDGVVYHVHCWTYNAWKFDEVPIGEHDLQKRIGQPK